MDAAFDDLVARAVARDDLAWRELVALVGRPVLGYARAQGADPEEILAEVLVELVRTIERFEGDSAGFKSWAIRIAHSRIIDRRRRSNRRPELVTAELPERIVEGDLASELADSERVRELLETLPPAQRDIVLLRVIGGLSVEETARSVGKRPGAVRTAMHRALASLRETVSAEV